MSAGDEIEIFTDGGCSPNPGPGGWGVTIRQSGLEVGFLKGGLSATTNNVMEMTAVMEALRWLDGRPAVVWSDSQYVVKGLNEWRSGWKRRGWRKADGPIANRDLWIELDALANRSKSVFKWCRSHTGNEGNERADALVHEGRAEARRRAS